MDKFPKKGLLLVISGPSGAGKGTICKELVKDENIKYSISATTRAPRGSEENGKDYFFLSTEEFEQRINTDGFLEWAKVYDRYYGTPRDFVEEVIDDGKACILEIDVQGALKIRDSFPEAVLIFILPPSLSELYRRLKDRGTESEEQIQTRMSWVLGEIAQIEKYDYVIVNDDLAKAVTEARAIVESEKCRVIRQSDILAKFQEENEGGHIYGTAND